MFHIYFYEYSFHIVHLYWKPLVAPECQSSILSMFQVSTLEHISSPVLIIHDIFRTTNILRLFWFVSVDGGGRNLMVMIMTALFIWDIYRQSGTQKMNIKVGSVNFQSRPKKMNKRRRTPRLFVAEWRKNKNTWKLDGEWASSQCSFYSSHGKI